MRFMVKFVNNNKEYIQTALVDKSENHKNDI